MERLPPFGDILRETFGRFFQEWLTALGLALVYGALFVVVIWPFADELALLSYIPDEAQANFLAQGGITLSGVLLMGVIIFLVYSALNVIWVRSALLGRADAMTDGAYGLFLRTLTMAWRQLVAVGWLLLAGIVGLLFAWVSGRYAVIFIVVIPAALAIAPALGLTMAGAAVDEPVTMRRAIAILGPNIFKLVLPVMLILILPGIPAVIEVGVMAGATAETVDIETAIPTYLTFQFVEQALAAWAGFLWLTLSGVVLGRALESGEG